MVGLVEQLVLPNYSPPLFAADFVVVAWMSVSVVVGSRALDGYKLRSSIRAGLNITEWRHVESKFGCFVVDIVECCGRYKR